MLSYEFVLLIQCKCYKIFRKNIFKNFLFYRIVLVGFFFFFFYINIYNIFRKKLFSSILLNNSSCHLFSYIRLIFICIYYPWRLSSLSFVCLTPNCCEMYLFYLCEIKFVSDLRKLFFSRVLWFSNTIKLILMML